VKPLSSSPEGEGKPPDSYSSPLGEAGRGLKLETPYIHIIN